MGAAGRPAGGDDGGVHDTGGIRGGLCWSRRPAAAPRLSGSRPMACCGPSDRSRRRAWGWDRGWRPRRSASSPGASTSPPPRVMACSRLTAGPGRGECRWVPVRSWTWWRTATICWRWVAGRVAPRMWRGTIEGERLAWSPDNTAPFRTAVAGRLVSDGERAIVLGWDRATETPPMVAARRPVMVAPCHAGRLRWPSTRGGRRAAGDRAVGKLASNAGRMPVFLAPGRWCVWEREAIPVMPAPTAPNPRTCGPKPQDLLGLLSADSLWAAICFGDAPITVRGWSVPCDGCYSRSAGTWRAEWLAQPADRGVIHLAPYKSTDWGTVDGVLHPSDAGPAPARALAGGHRTLRRSASGVMPMDPYAGG